MNRPYTRAISNPLRMVQIANELCGHCHKPLGYFRLHTNGAFEDRIHIECVTEYDDLVMTGVPEYDAVKFFKPGWEKAFQDAGITVFDSTEILVIKDLIKNAGYVLPHITTLATNTLGNKAGAAFLTKIGIYTRYDEATDDQQLDFDIVEKPKPKYRTGQKVLANGTQVVTITAALIRSTSVLYTTAEVQHRFVETELEELPKSLYGVSQTVIVKSTGRQAKVTGVNYDISRKEYRYSLAFENPIAIGSYVEEHLTSPPPAIFPGGGRYA